MEAIPQADSTATVTGSGSAGKLDGHGNRAVASHSPERRRDVRIDRRPWPHDALSRLPVAASTGVAADEPATDYVILPTNGLQFPRHLPFDIWLGIGKKLSAVADCSAWCLGDWLIYGQEAYSGRYRDAIEHTSLSYKTLRNYAWVARQVPLARRRETLSFGHHAEVAALPEVEQRYWLRMTEKHGWSRNRMRHEVRASLVERMTADPSKPEKVPPSSEASPASAEQSAAVTTGEIAIVVKATTEQFELYRLVAAQEGYSVAGWATKALDYAARRRWQAVSRRRDTASHRPD